MAFVALAEALRRRGRHEEALGVLREGARHHPEHSAARVVLARIHLDRGQRPLAEELLAEVVRTDPENLAANGLLALLYTEEGREVEAAPLLERLRMHNALEASLAEALEQRSPRGARLPRGADPLDHPRFAERLQAMGALAAAAGVWRRILQVHPNHPYALHHLRKLEEAQGAPLALDELAIAPLEDAPRVPAAARARAVRRYAARVWRLP